MKATCANLNQSESMSILAASKAKASLCPESAASSNAEGESSEWASGSSLCNTGVSGGIHYEGIYMVKVILTEIYMLEYFL